MCGPFWKKKTFSICFFGHACGLHHLDCVGHRSDIGITGLTFYRCSAVYTERHDIAAGKAVLAMIFCFNGVSGWAFPGLTMTYTTEILPYQIRAKGVALCWTFISIASLINQYVNPIGLQNIAWKFYFVYIAILIIEVMTFYFVFPETKG